MKTPTFQRIQAQSRFTPPDDWQQFYTVDMHTGGEPLRVILDGFPELKGDSVLAKRRDCRDHHDHLRTALMFEPRGHADMYGCLLVPPNDPEGDFGILFLHNAGYSSMCGHAIIAISTLAVEMQWVDSDMEEVVLQIDAPCGRITSYTQVENGKVKGVRFHCVPSFVVGLDREVEVPGWGKVRYDLAYGGAFYAYVDLEKNALDLGLEPEDTQALIVAGRAIKQAVIAADPGIVHPFEPDLSFLYGTIFIGPSPTEGIHSRNVCIFADGEVDRCPTGSGVSGRMAIHHARGEIKARSETQSRGETQTGGKIQTPQTMAIESITGSVFRASVVETLTYGPYAAVIPQVEGTAHITGMQTFVIDPTDPMRNGFILR